MSTPSTAQTKIINGTPVPDGSSPQIVALYITEDDPVDGLVDSICTGTVLSARHVLTAAHCVEGQSIISIAVVSGAVVKPVSGYAIHPNYQLASDGGLLYDVAVLETSEDMGLPALPLVVSDELTAGDQVGIWGYGLDENDNVGALKTGFMNVDLVAAGRFFALFDGISTGNTCFGDSGGPATLATVDAAGNPVIGVVGLTSGGTSEDCSAGDRSSFTDVQFSFITDFILSIAPETQVL